jgi:hypothetical protein
MCHIYILVRLYENEVIAKKTYVSVSWVTCDLSGWFTHPQRLARNTVEGSVVDPRLYFSDPDPTLTLISDPDPDLDPDCLRNIYLKCRSSKHRKKANFFNLYILGSGLFRKIYLNCRSSEHCKKANFFKTCTFLQLCVCYLETELNLDPDLNLDPESNLELITDPDPNLQII